MIYYHTIGFLLSPRKYIKDVARKTTLKRQEENMMILEVDGVDFSKKIFLTSEPPSKSRDAKKSVMTCLVSNIVSIIIIIIIIIQIMTYRRKA